MDNSGYGSSSRRRGRRNKNTSQQNQENSIMNLIAKNFAVVSRSAVPLSITTRGIGFATAIFFDQKKVHFRLEEVESIVSIHAMYRVHLWLLYRKVERSEFIGSCAIWQMFEYSRIVDDIRYAIATVGTIPYIISIIMDAVGHIKNGNHEWKCGFTKPPTNDFDLMNYRTAVIHPGNIRQLVLDLANPETPEAFRLHFIAHNSIPGARFSQQNLLENPDDIYPNDYDATALKTEISQYNTFMYKMTIRLPSETVTQVKLNDGKGFQSGLVSNELQPVSLVSTFEESDGYVYRFKERDAQGVLHRKIQEVPASNRYTGYQIKQASRSNFWALAEINPELLVQGVMSMVGETVGLTTRDEINSGFHMSGDSISTMQHLVH